ncbi:malto-oligosyltrehalose trehalohydrolase [Herpetosiphon geysericola]|uniref:Malto-oligosyltrehalose trehalohydrolase n=1 Tax=Herpetosiphon geysericola TaxID=70996 RepID=A0A0P6XVI0_9CHLR|nr:malto-oligosyltrehalose trehalohydrolase [Herpetosiphon geysericola]
MPAEHGCYRFRVWAPHADSMTVVLETVPPRRIPMDAVGDGYYEALVADVGPGTLYRYGLTETLIRPDPASQAQPQGVHGPSMLVDRAFAWHDADWDGLALHDYVIYELHVGTFTRAGTFDAIIPHLDGLKDLGITAIELMPLGQFPGTRNWGYDGVYPFAVQDSYGGPLGLKRLVDACHARGLAVVVDVVYNHLGPEGNYLADYGPYFTDRYSTPWGTAINFDGPGSDAVRDFFIANACFWFSEFHIDALRLDAVHAYLDFAAVTFLERLTAAVADLATVLSRRCLLFAESNRNDARTITPRDQHGFGCDAQWNDDFHHALRTVLTGDRTGYYQDFGAVADVATAYRDGFVYTGQYSPFRDCRHGSPASHLPAARFIVFAQNHDHVGNRMYGERLGALVSFERLKIAAGLVLLAPAIPLLFMGEEYAESAPFLYFVDHGDPDLLAAIREGRRTEFAAFAWDGEPPDPADPATFQHSILQPELQIQGQHAVLRAWYRTLLQLRRSIPALATLDRTQMTVTCDALQGVLSIERWAGSSRVMLMVNFHDVAQAVPLPAGRWHGHLDSAALAWQPDGQAHDAGLALDDQVVVGETLMTLPPTSFRVLVWVAEHVPSSHEDTV